MLSKEIGAPGEKHTGGKRSNETIGNEGGARGDVSTDPVVSGDTSKTAYTATVSDTQSSRIRLRDISAEDTADNITGSSGVG